MRSLLRRFVLWSWRRILRALDPGRRPDPRANKVTVSGEIDAAVSYHLHAPDRGVTEEREPVALVVPGVLPVPPGTIAIPGSAAMDALAEVVRLGGAVSTCIENGSGEQFLLTLSPRRECHESTPHRHDSLAGAPGGRLPGARR